LQPKNLLFWGNFAQIEKKSPEFTDSPISGEKNNYCVGLFMTEKHDLSDFFPPVTCVAAAVVAVVG
jgi:hypothetical protein